MYGLISPFWLMPTGRDAECAGLRGTYEPLVSRRMYQCAALLGTCARRSLTHSLDEYYGTNNPARLAGSRDLPVPVPASIVALWSKTLR